MATQLATNTVIIFFLYNGCLFLRPYRLWHMRRRSIRLIPRLSTNAKVSKVEQNTHMAMQLRCRACPDIADNPPLPQPCKEVLHPCTIETMDIIILLLVVSQGFLTNIKYSGVQTALIGAVMRPDFKIEKLSMCSRRTTLIPNHNIGAGSGHKVTNPYYIFEIVHRHGYLIKVACVLGIKEDIRQLSTQLKGPHRSMDCESLTPTQRASGCGTREVTTWNNEVWRGA